MDKKEHLKQLQEYAKEYRRKNPEWFRGIKRRSLHEKKGKLIKLKGGKCSECGLKYNGKNACVFQFHHKERGNKIERSINLSGKIKALLKEIKKCKLVCANCHFLLHYKNYYGEKPDFPKPYQEYLKLKRMHKENIHLNRAIVILKKAGISFYSIILAFKEKDKRNFMRIYKRDKNKYFLPSEKNGNK